MTTRREVILAVAAGMLGAPACLARMAFAQEQKMRRVGFLHSNSPETAKYVLEAFRQGLRSAGYVEGKNVLLEFRWAGGKSEQLPVLAAELVNLKVDVLFAPATLPAQAAKHATASIPIVFATVPDPVAIHLVASLAKPGGNITGTTIVSVELQAKRLQLFKEAAPKISRLAIVGRASSLPDSFPLIESTARRLGIEVSFFEINRTDDLGRRTAAIRNWRSDSLYILESATNALNRAALADLALQLKIPAFGGASAYADAGALMSYGASYQDSYRRSGVLVGKILGGAKPSELPVEEPTKFELVVNMKTAKALGIVIPQPVLLRADRVIE